MRARHAPGYGECINVLGFPVLEGVLGCQVCIGMLGLAGWGAKIALQFAYAKMSMVHCSLTPHTPMLSSQDVLWVTSGSMLQYVRY